jgi:hypothetical protein
MYLRSIRRMLNPLCWSYNHIAMLHVSQPNSLERSQFCKDLIHKILIECGFKPSASLKENKIDSDINDNLAIERAEENNTCSDSITLDDLTEDERWEI